jgi:hypothetical protein
MLPEYAVLKYFAWQLVRSSGGSIEDYFTIVRTRDRYELLEAFGLMRTEHYLSLEPTRD